MEINISNDEDLHYMHKSSSIFIYLVIQQMLLSKATYKWGHYRSNQNQQKSNNMQVPLQVLVSRTQYTEEGIFFKKMSI